MGKDTNNTYISFEIGRCFFFSKYSAEQDLKRKTNFTAKLKEQIW